MKKVMLLFAATAREFIIQFIHLMRPIYLASPTCFQGERSIISEKHSHYLTSQHNVH